MVVLGVQTPKKQWATTDDNSVTTTTAAATKGGGGGGRNATTTTTTTEESTTRYWSGNSQVVRVSPTGVVERQLVQARRALFSLRPPSGRRRGSSG